MAVSQHEDKLINIQRQLRQNQHDLQDYLSDLGSWEEEMKTKEQELLKSKSNEPQTLPPVRNSLDKKKLKKKKKKKSDQQKVKQKISGFDFRAWDKFDVDKALEEMDAEEKNSSSEYETDEEWENERKKHLANEEKNTGNSHLSAGAYEVAVECYTRGMDLDPTNALLPANRAMAFIKMEKYGVAEVDCTTAITLDPLYVKAYLRRAAARVGLQRLQQALEDYERVLQLEPSNKQAQKEVDRLRKELDREKGDARPSATSLEKAQTSEVKAVYKPPEQRSKKPLRRIEIEEIGVKDNTERKEAIAKVEAKQSSAKKAMEAKDRQMFEKFAVKASGDMDDKATKDKVGSQNVNTANDMEGHIDTKNIHSELTRKEETLAKKDSLSQQTDALVSPKMEVAQSSGDLHNKHRHQNGTVSTKPSSPRESGNFIDSILDRDPPQTSFQFQSDFRVLKDNLQAFYTYFKRIDPTLFPKLFGKSLEAPMLLKIVEAICKCGIPANDDCFDQLKNLSEVNRFSTTVMFFSNKDKQGIREIFQYLKSKGDYPECGIAKLMKKYEV